MEIFDATMRIAIPLKPQSWNVLVRKHYRVVQAFKNEWDTAVFFQVKKDKLLPVRIYPVALDIEAHWKFKKRHDIDALCTKFAVDALVRAGILLDDDLSHVSRVTFTGKIGQPIDELIIDIKNTLP